MRIPLPEISRTPNGIDLMKGYIEKELKTYNGVKPDKYFILCLQLHTSQYFKRNAYDVEATLIDCLCRFFIIKNRYYLLKTASEKYIDKENYLEFQIHSIDHEL